MSITAIATKKLIHRIIESGADPIKAQGFMIKILKINRDSVRISFDVVDRDGKTLVELVPTMVMNEGETMRIMELDAVFNINVG